MNLMPSHQPLRSSRSAFLLLICAVVGSGAVGCESGDAVKKFGGGGTGGKQSGVDAGLNDVGATGGSVSTGGVVGGGGVPGSGGDGISTGGVIGGGGISGTGGQGATLGSGGRGGTGGVSATGGTGASGGVTGTGSSSASGGRGGGGVSGSGGVTSTGGRVGTGGATGSGGIIGTGGVIGTGGIIGTGGVGGTGGITGTGGATQATCDNLAAQYKKELPNAKVCSSNTRAACSVLVPDTLACSSCNTYVDADHNKNLLDLQEKWKANGCDRQGGVCIQVICVNPTGAKCTTSATGAESCQDTTDILVTE